MTIWESLSAPFRGKEEMKRLLTAVTIGGSDPTSGAGIQSDIKTFRDFQIQCFSIVTAITSQNCSSVHSVFPLSAEIIRSQMKAIFDDLPVGIVKIGMLCHSEQVSAIVEILSSYPSLRVIADPVLLAKNGTSLWLEKDPSNLIQLLFSRVFLLTPNLIEAERLTGLQLTEKYDIMKALLNLKRMGPANILIKGGHAKGNQCTDYLFDGKETKYFSTPRLATDSVHGTGCMLASAISANLLLGRTLMSSIKISRRYVRKKMKTALSLGKGYLKLMQ
jgi:hydroxymethylpyrimidine/phosphomethylpyrimidine kinase